MKYAVIDDDGIPTGFYDPLIHETIPKDAIEIDEENWMAHISGDYRKWDGSAWVKYTPPPPPLSFTKEIAKRRVIAYAEEIERELTAGYSQGEVASWPTKLTAAYNYISGSPTQAERILIETEAKEKGISPADLCNLHIIPNGEWYAETIALISSLRSKTFSAIDAATTQDEVDTILQNALAEANKKWVNLIAKKP